MVKPPLGIKPRKLWLEERASELCGAIGRYINAGNPDVEEWRIELSEIMSLLLPYVLKGQRPKR